MSDQNEPASREGRVSRRPLIIVVMFLVLVAVVGAIISTQARDEKALDTATVDTTTSSVVDDTAYPTVAPTSSTDEPSPTSSPSPSQAASGASCTPAALLAAADDSGQAAEGVIDSASVTRFNCIDDYAFARLSAPGLDEAEAYFEKDGNRWKLLVLGTSVDPEGQGIPADTVRQLAAD